METNSTYLPTILRINNLADKEIYNDLIKNKNVIIHNEIYSQLQELIKCLNPSIKIKAEDYDQYIGNHLKEKDINSYGVWVYYPWNRRFVHLLDKEEFITVRTNRNQYKITKDEQQILSNKKIGIVGLSVGQSIALTMAIERICGELRLADFDTVELSNLNRLRTPLYNLGLKKTIIAAREILEIDPFIVVKIFNNGLNSSNLDSFFKDGGNLDLFVEVCDGLDMKIESRYKARELEIPVVMDTNDRGMIDVERFDIEPGRPILHGLANGLSPENIKDLSNEDKIPYILKMVGIDTISTRLKASMMEVEQSINTWPQLASSVTLGGALTTDVCRRIFLDQYHDSGRYYLDMEDLIKDKIENRTIKNDISNYIPPAELSKNEMLTIINFYNKNHSNSSEIVDLDEEVVTKIVASGIIAPSGGNSQPWKFIYSNKELFIFHDAHFSYSLLDYNHLGSYVAIGASIENIYIAAHSLGFNTVFKYFPIENNNKLVAVANFNNTDNKLIDYYKSLERGIKIRLTNRETSDRQELSKDFYECLKSSIKSYPSAELHIIDNENSIKKIGDLLATTEMLRIIHPRGHYDTFKNELRWTQEQIIQKSDGLDVNTLGATKSEIAALKIAEDEEAINFLRHINGGNAFTKAVKKSVASSAALGIITMPKYSEINFLLGGRAVERIWIESNLKGVSFQPVSQLVFMLARLNQEKGNDFGDIVEKELRSIEQELNRLLPNLMNNQIIFIFRLCKANNPEVRSLRRSIASSFTYISDYIK